MPLKKVILGVGLALGLGGLVGLGALLGASAQKVSLLKKGAYVQSPSFEIVPTRPQGWALLKDIPPSVVGPIVISEDWAFYDHKGVDYRQVVQALWDYTQGEKLRGASTISQQVVKNLFLGPERALWRKIKEWALAFYLEARLTKEQILEIYLNILHLGANLYGVSQGAAHYFALPLGELSYREGAFLAMLLPNPEHYSRHAGAPGPYALQTMEEILGKLKVAEQWDDDRLEEEGQRPLRWGL